MSSPSDTGLPSAATLLAWYDRHRRTMPWRAGTGQQPDPYRVWLSEIMLQQTTVVAVIPYFERFLARFPSVSALAAAPGEAVMEAWAGLGYYARARNMHACAQVVAAAGGCFPTDLESLGRLPGVGPYTAAAIASIAFGQPVIPVDGNVERVTARVFDVHSPLPAARPRLSLLAQTLGREQVARDRAGDFTQALFDMGATICIPRRPACVLCPWQTECRARALGTQEQLPVKASRPSRPVRFGAHFWLQDERGRVLLRRRPPRGLLGGMLELPGLPWQHEAWDGKSAIAAAPQVGPWRKAGTITHVFTHFEARLDVYAAAVVEISAEGKLCDIADLPGAALPSMMRKCVEVARFTLR